MVTLYLLAATLNAWVMVLILAAAFGVQLIAGEPHARSVSCSASRS
jgi:hypothetical protein